MGRPRGDKREREGRRTLGSPAVSGAYKDGPAPSLRLPICLPLYLTYFPLFIAILKDSHPPLTRRQPFSPPSAMARRKALLHAQHQHANSSHASPSTRSPLSVREYYNARYEKVDKSHRLTTLYADVTNSHIDRLEGLWRECVNPQYGFYRHFAHIVNPRSPGIATPSTSILITHSEGRWWVESRTFFIGCATTTLSRKSVRSRPTGIN